MLATAVLIRLFLLAIVPIFLAMPSPLKAESPLKVTEFRCYDSEDKKRVEKINGNDLNVCKIDDRVYVDVVGSEFDTWDKEKGNTLEKLILSLNGHLLTGNHARIVPHRAGQDENGIDEVSVPAKRSLVFVLQRNHAVEANIAAWKAILPRTTLLEPEIMEIAVALAGTSQRYMHVVPDKRNSTMIGVRVASVGRIVTVAILYGVLLLLFLIAAIWHGILREAEADEFGRKPYSLGRTQMSFWFWIVLFFFLYLWIVTGDFNVLTPGVLGLIGISATTGLVAAVMPEKKEPPETSAEKMETLTTETAKLQKKIEAAPDSADLEEWKTRNTEIINKIVKLNKRIKAKTKPRERWSFDPVLFLLDLVRGEGEVSLPRFQMVAWTLILGMVFAHSAWTTLNMPEFTAELLGLMGLSSGTYIGFKLPKASDG